MSTPLGQQREILAGAALCVEDVVRILRPEQVRAICEAAPMLSEALVNLSAAALAYADALREHYVAMGGGPDVATFRRGA